MPTMLSELSYRMVSLILNFPAHKSYNLSKIPNRKFSLPSSLLLPRKLWSLRKGYHCCASPFDRHNKYILDLFWGERVQQFLGNIISKSTEIDDICGNYRKILNISLTIPRFREQGTWSSSSMAYVPCNKYAILIFSFLFRWDKMASMAVTRSRVGLAASFGKLWAIGGYDGANNLSTVEEYNPEKDEWNFAPSMVAHEGGVGVGVIPGPYARNLSLKAHSMNNSENYKE